jgi:hypothetical protein
MDRIWTHLKRGFVAAAERREVVGVDMTPSTPISNDNEDAAMEGNCDKAEENASVSLPPTQDNADGGTGANTLPQKRKRKAAPVDGFFVQEEKRKPARTRKKEVSTEDEFDTFWTCCECNETECMMKPEADQLLICEGPCRRLSHYPCAGLSELPHEDEKYICNDCISCKHPCSICQQYGVDDEDVFCCSKGRCGLFFHESCLSMQNVEVTVIQEETNDTINDAMCSPGTSEVNRFTGRRQFVCPAHWCWTCTQKDMQKQEEQTESEQPKKKGKKKKKTHSSFDCKTEHRIVVSIYELYVYVIWYRLSHCPLFSPS